MNTNLTSLISSTAAVLAMASSAFAEPSKPMPMNDNGCPCTPFEQGMLLTKCENFPPAYNAPARTEVRCSWDIFFTADFIYWFVQQDGMDIGFNTTTLLTDVLPPSDGLKKSQKGGWQPGFKVGLGADFDIDHWVGYLEYTRLHASTSQSLTAPSGQIINLGTWYGHYDIATAHTAPSVSSKWRVNLDMLDALMSRPYYEGRNLTITPFAGIRALLLRQNFRLSADVPATVGVPSPVVSQNQSRSWGLGPRLGMQSHWLLGLGFRLEADAAAALLFQRYTTVAHRGDAVSTAPQGAAELIQYNNYGCMRPIMDMGLGIGWGTYLDCQNYYLDLVANYDFLFFWGQNMMRHLVDDYGYGIDGAPADLFYNGLTLQFRFDF